MLGLLTLCGVSVAQGQTEITLLSPNPIEATINKLVADFEAKTGTHVKITYGTGVSTRKDGRERPGAGCLAPVRAVSRSAQDRQHRPEQRDRHCEAAPGDRGEEGRAEAGHLDTRGGQAHAAECQIHHLRGSRAGERRRRGAAGARQDWASPSSSKPKIKWVPTGGVVQDSVAKGEYEIAFGPYLSDMRNPGLDVVGALPPEAAHSGRHHRVPVHERERPRRRPGRCSTISHRPRPRRCTSAKMFAVSDK